MDGQLLFLINQQWTHSILDYVLSLIACLDLWFPILLIAGGFFWWRGGIRSKTYLVLCLSGILVNEALISKPLKVFTNKRRPHEAIEHVRRVDMSPAKPRILSITHAPVVSFSSAPSPTPTNRGRSFPSSHVLNAMTLGFMTFACFGFRCALLFPFLMAWSRVYSGAHWPIDVVSSILIGLTSNLLLLLILDSLWEKFKNRYRPEWGADLPSLTLLFPPRKIR